MKKVISFDLWDTILKRKCHPQEIKLHTCQYIYFNYHNLLNKEYKSIYDILNLRTEIEIEICNNNKEKRFDWECNIVDVFKKMCKIMFKISPKNIIQELINVEVDFEKQMTYLNPEIKNIFEKYEGYDFYCVSDFYMGADLLKKIIYNIDGIPIFKKIFSSADYLLTKKTGRLFQKVIEELDVDYNEVIHIGDNTIVDISVPNALGIKTYLIKKKDTFPNVNMRILNINELIGSRNAKTVYDIGRYLAIIPYYFILKILYEECSGNKIYYFSREGEIFLNIHNIIVDNNLYFKNKIKGDLLEVSRLATFSPSLQECSINELMNLWRQYDRQSIGTLFKTLNLNINEYECYLSKYEISPDKSIFEPWKNKKILQLFSDKKFCSQVKKDIRSRRNQLINYFRIKGINLDDDKLSIVDIGWRGTIQDNLSKIYSQKIICGYYLALFKYINEQPKNVVKNSIIENEEFINKYVGGLITFFEMIFIPNTGSVIGYHNGKAIREISNDENEFITNRIIELQNGMYDGVKTLNEYFNIHPYDIKEIYEAFLTRIKEVREKPNKLMCETYFNQVLNNNFGAGNYVKKSKMLLKDKLSLKKTINLMRKEPWKEAFIKYNNLYLIRVVYYIKKMRRMW